LFLKTISSRVVLASRDITPWEQLSKAETRLP
jgi:hypothetical protein